MRKPLLEAPTVGTQGGVIGRPRKMPPTYTPRQIRESPPENIDCLIERLASEHMSLKRIAVELGTTAEVLRRWMQDDPMLRWAHEAGKARAEHELKMILIENAREGDKPNINALVVLKCVHGWREGDAGEQPGRLNITFNLPGAMTREQFERSIVPTQEAGNG